MTITNIRTKVQFTQYGEVKCFIVNANKLRAMNIIKSVFGVKSLSLLHEFKADGFLPEGYYSQVSPINY
jgi:hypothetical protein